MKGFDEFRVKTIRNDPDWKNEYVDYSGLKANITSFLKRRKYIIDLISSGSSITVEDFESIRVFNPNKLKSGYESKKNTDEPTNDYIPFNDEENKG